MAQVMSSLAGACGLGAAVVSGGKTDSRRTRTRELGSISQSLCERTSTEFGHEGLTTRWPTDTMPNAVHGSHEITAVREQTTGSAAVKLDRIEESPSLKVRTYRSIK